MTDTDTKVAALGADAVIWTLARSAGIPEEATVARVDEILFENLSEDNAFALEVWTRFEFEDEEGQRGFAHLPGRLDALIPNTVRRHTQVEIGDELAD